MEHDLAHWIHALPGKRVLLVGDLILDRYVFGDAERISPEAPVPILRVVESREAVGGSANVAACLRALGCEVAVCGVVGHDANADRLRAMLDRLGADASGVLAVSGRPTTTKTRLVGLAQHRHRQQLLRIDEEETQPLGEADAGALAALAVALVRDVDVICIEDYDKGVVVDSVVQAILAEAAKANRTVLVDPARLESYERYRGAGMITPNREELSVAVGRRLTSLDQVGDAARELIGSFGFGAIVATVDREGAVVVTSDGECTHLPTTPRAVYDNTGAGDAVLAMLAAATAGGADLISAATLANVAGGLEVEKFGCVPITADEVLADLRLTDRKHNGKLGSVEEVAAELSLRRDRGETVVFTNGCFDILHAGHVDFLRRCSREGSALVIGLNTDSSVRSLGKGDDRPINSFEDRAMVLGALECVDYVVGFDEETPENLIRRLRPDVLAKGADWADRGVVGREFVESYGGRVVLLPLVPGLSTSHLVERIRSERQSR